MTTNINLKKAVFTIDGIEGEEFAGFTSGMSWNGWACPYFTKEVAERIMDKICEWGNTKAWYVEENNTYYTNLNCDSGYCDEEDTEWWEGSEYIVNGESVVLYCVGGGSWCWDEEVKELTEYQRKILRELSFALHKISEECGDSEFFHNDIICELNGFNKSIDELACEVRNIAEGE